MSYNELSSDSFYYFSDTEKTFIESYLEAKGYTWSTNTVCGSCCGMFADEYWVNGIGGDFKKADRLTLSKLMEEKGYQCSIGGYTISADPDDEEEYQVKI